MSGSDNVPLLKDKSINVFGCEVINDDHLGDVVWVCPMKTSEASLRTLGQDPQGPKDLPKCNGSYYGWDAVYKSIECQAMANDIFLADRPKSKEEELPTSKARLKADFGKNMTRLEFHQKVMERVVDILSGERVGLGIQTTESADKDEIFLCLSMPTEGRIVKLVANSEGYRARVRADKYPMDRAGKPTKVPIVDGEHAVAWTTYDIDEDDKFQQFRDIDKLRMMRRRISHFVDISSLIKYGIVIVAFPVHKKAKVDELNDYKTNFGNWRQWWKLPSYNLNAAKEYFGEEVAFFFHWFRFYTTQLIIPTMVACLLLTRKVFLTPAQQKEVQDCFALFMALWAAQFCENYNRHAVIQSTLWGTRNFDNVAVVRAQYKDCDEADKKATWWSALAASVISFFIALIVCGIAIIQATRFVMVHDPMENPISAFFVEITGSKELGSKMGAKFGAIMITGQVKVLDAIWGKIARFVTDRENHKTDSRYQSSLVFKVVTVKFFNAMYPFMYVAFAKEYVEGCKSKDGSCIPALELTIVMFFFVHLGVTMTMLVKRIVFTRIKIRKEMKKQGIKPENYTYLQVQAKCDSFKGEDLLPDYMELTVQFAMVTCFSVVLPILTGLALVSNMIEFRLIAFRQLSVVQRPHPSGSEGIGAWQSIFAGIATLAMIVNAGLAVFAMQPFRSEDNETRLIAFMIGEHVLLLSKMAVEIAIPDLPAQVDKAEDKNEDACAKMFGGGYKSVHITQQELSLKTSLPLSVDEAKQTKYNPFHLAGKK